ncbi:MAG: low molecular weight phosphotyrosine protein phosphatase [Deltaproteobacteria bacterium]|nr:low molecular weight phosphotyrosine protein phosphatase [Deltaproteobacteria bacterium]
MAVTRVCFVCLGNICRSPTAEGVFRHLVDEAGVSAAFEIDSAGTAAYHEGEPPDRRSTAAAASRGVHLGGRARQFRREDFARFDHVLAMDQQNRDALQQLAPDAPSRAKVRLLRDLDPSSEPGSEVPDPYYGGPQGFDIVFDICMAACGRLLAELQDTDGR